MTTEVVVPFLDLRASVAEHRAELDAAWARVMESGLYVLGPEVKAFEEEFAAYCEADHCVGVASGLDALRLLFEALGIGPGDEIIVPAYTAVATWMAVTAVGASPIGVDVEADSFNLDPELVEAALTERTKAIVAVHLFGRPADVDRLGQVAAGAGIPLLEDAAQAHGARHRDRRVGSLGRAAAFSFYPTKTLGAFGDGGAVVTSDAELADRVRLLRMYGWRDRSVSEIVGGNSRLDELQAALLRVRLSHLDDDIQRRKAVARTYAEVLGGITGLELPNRQAAESDEPAWHVYATRVTMRDVVQRSLADDGIGSLVHYEPLPHLTPAYRAAGLRPGDFPVAERLAAAELSLPFFPQLDQADVRRVAAALRRALSF